MDAGLRQRTADVLDGLPVGEAFDLVKRVSITLTTAMLATLFDFPWEERHKLPIWSDWAAKIDIGLDPVLNAEREKHVFEMAAYFKKLFDERKDLPPQPNLLSMMAHSAAMSNLDEQRFMGNIALLVVGGNDTTRNSMSGLVDQIIKQPDQWAKVKADPSLATTAATETIRLLTPICHMRRTARGGYGAQWPADQRRATRFSSGIIAATAMKMCFQMATNGLRRPKGCLLASPTDSTR